MRWILPDQTFVLVKRILLRNPFTAHTLNCLCGIKKQPRVGKNHL